MEAFQKALQELVCIVNSLCIFAHNPDHSCSGIWLIQRIKVFTKCGNDTLIPNLTKAELERVIIKTSCALSFFLPKTNLAFILLLLQGLQILVLTIVTSTLIIPYPLFTKYLPLSTSSLCKAPHPMVPYLLSTS